MATTSETSVEGGSGRQVYSNAPSIQGDTEVTGEEGIEVQVRPKIKIENTHSTDQGQGDIDKTFKSRTIGLQRLLKLYFYSAVKYSNHRCSFHFVYFLFMVLQITKLSCITAQMFSFGHERENFNSVVKRGHVTLKNLLLKGWDASWETPPYPPAHGDFAVYDIQGLKEKVNYAVEKLYNAEEDAIGFYKRPKPDSVTAEIVYFDFGGFKTGDTFHGLSVKTQSFTVDVRSHTNETTNETTYTYDVDADFQRNNLTEPVKRLLKFNLNFKIDSVRVYIDSLKARCLNINGQIQFRDPDDNGQVTVELVTKTERQICKDLGYDVADVTIEAVSQGLIVVVLVLAFISLAYTIVCIAFGIFVYWKTKRYMKEHYMQFFEPERYKEELQQQPAQGTFAESRLSAERRDLPVKEYLRFIKGWDLLVLVADLTTIIGNLGLELQMDQTWTVERMDNFTVLLGLGCMFSWIGLLRYFKFNYKFHLLFNTLYASFFDVMAYLACICVLFVGYMSFGYVVLGPYHIKFKTPSATAETLFSIVNGDEIYATFALLEVDQTGGALVPVIYKIYLGTFIAIFTIIILNLFIALFTNAYDSIKKQYEDPEDQEEGPIESALKHLLVSRESVNVRFTGSVRHLLETDRNTLSAGEDNLRTQLMKIVSISKSKRNFVLKQPKTIKAFINSDLADSSEASGEDNVVNYKCCCAISCLFGCCKPDEIQFCLKSPT